MYCIITSSFVLNYSPLLPWDLLEVLDTSVEYSVPEQANHRANGHWNVVTIDHKLARIASGFAQFLLLFTVTNAEHNLCPVGHTIFTVEEVGDTEEKGDWPIAAQIVERVQ